jgi:hypothetical protein
VTAVIAGAARSGRALHPTRDSRACHIAADSADGGTDWSTYDCATDSANRPVAQPLLRLRLSDEACGCEDKKKHRLFHLKVLCHNSPPVSC